jgi:glycosyltransferase involved in cell wall biosynthesis
MGRLSVITICFNNPGELKKTCASVDAQLRKPYEHIIIDGSTNNEIKEWLEKTKQPGYRKWLNERDKGIADAFNKGIKIATGDITSTLNSGDELFDDTVLQRVMDVFESDSAIMWLNGKLKTYRGDTWAIVGKAFEKEKLYRGMHGVFHPTMYIKKTVYEKHGYYDTNIRIAMDYDMLCRISGEKNTFIDYPLAIFDPTGVSTTNYVKGTEECFASYRKYYGSSIKHLLWKKRLLFLNYLLNTTFGKALYKIKVTLQLQRR